MPGFLPGDRILGFSPKSRTPAESGTDGKITAAIFLSTRHNTGHSPPGAARWPPCVNATPDRRTPHGRSAARTHARSAVPMHVPPAVPPSKHARKGPTYRSFVVSRGGCPGPTSKFFRRSLQIIGERLPRALPHFLPRFCRDFRTPGRFSAREGCNRHEKLGGPLAFFFSGH